MIYHLKLRSARSGTDWRHFSGWPVSSINDCSSYMLMHECASTARSTSSRLLAGPRAGLPGGAKIAQQSCLEAARTASERVQDRGLVLSSLYGAAAFLPPRSGGRCVFLWFWIGVAKPLLGPFPALSEGQLAAKKRPLLCSSKPSIWRRLLVLTFDLGAALFCCI